MGNERLDMTIRPVVGMGGEAGFYGIIIDRVSQRAWTGAGRTETAALTAALRKFLKDRRALEYVGEE